MLAIVSAASAAGPGVGARERASSLRTEVTKLVATRHAALLDLYALDTRSRATQTRMSSLIAAATRLQRMEAKLGVQLATTTDRLATSRQHLSDSLRALYEQGDVNEIAVVLSAQSLDDAVTRIDDLNAVADRSRQIVQAAAAAKARQVHLRTLLNARSAKLKETIASLRGSDRTLAAARAERVTFVAQLRTREQLRDRQVRALETAARLAAQKSAHLQAAPAAAAPAHSGTVTTRAGVTTPARSATPPSSNAPPVATGGRAISVSSTGYSLHGNTATGLPTGWGVVAVDPSVIPLGTRLTIPGYGTAVAADVGSGVRGAMIDLWFPTLAQARAWGRRTVTITLH